MSLSDFSRRYEKLPVSIFKEQEDASKMIVDDIIITANKKINEGELKGCVPVDAELKVILEKFMEYHAGFSGVEHQWLKCCYYYQHFGPSNI